jgi:hypothetical protein
MKHSRIIFFTCIAGSLLTSVGYSQAPPPAGPWATIKPMTQPMPPPAPAPRENPINPPPMAGAWGPAPVQGPPPNPNGPNTGGYAGPAPNQSYAAPPPGGYAYPAAPSNQSNVVRDPYGRVVQPYAYPPGYAAPQYYYPAPQYREGQAPTQRSPNTPTQQKYDAWGQPIPSQNIYEP